MHRRHFLQSTSALLFPRLACALPMEFTCDAAVIGAGTGGCAAALALLRNHMRVVLTEETGWIGGQLTSQAVPPDEHSWIEQFGCTGSYRAYRNAVRDYYRTNFPLTAVARARTNLNPGNGTVSRLTHEPRASLAVLEALLQPYTSSGKLTVLLRHAPVAATTTRDRVTSVAVSDFREQTERAIKAKYFIDATELGDLLSLAKVEHVTGSEAQAGTGEMHAASKAEPANSQAFTFCFAIDHMEGEDHTIERPESYPEWRDYLPQLTPPWTGRLLDWTYCIPQTLAANTAFLEPNSSGGAKGLNLWNYRRIADRTNFTPGSYPSDITLVNWPQNDFWLGDLITANPAQRKVYLDRAKQLSLSLLYWMQTAAPRPDGGLGWKGLRLRPDVTGTDDGLAKAPYIRESRRIEAEFTVVEQHVGVEMRKPGKGRSQRAVTAEPFPDTVGIGSYRIDLHPSAGGNNYVDIESVPFQIPLGSLIPKRVENLLPGCKNLGTTHVTNGCYRLHPVEWNIGEAAGELAARAIRTHQTPRAIRARKAALTDFQNSLRARGFELEWPSEVSGVRTAALQPKPAPPRG